jgi:hypothetical protein
MGDTVYMDEALRAVRIALRAEGHRRRVSIRRLGTGNVRELAEWMVASPGRSGYSWSAPANR